VTNDRPKADRIRHLAWSGIASTTWNRYSGTKARKWEYAVTDLGFKYQMNDLAASIGLVQFNKLKSNNFARAQIFKRYNQHFNKLNWVKTPAIKSWAQSSHHNYFIKVDKKIRNKLIDYLNQQGISANVHYLPNHFYPLFAGFPHQVPVTNKVWQEIVLLPIFPDLSLKDQNFIINAVFNFSF